MNVYEAATTFRTYRSATVTAPEAAPAAAPSATEWKIDRDARTATHISGFRVGFARPHTLAPQSAFYVIGLFGIEKLKGTRWEGQSSALSDAAVDLWRAL